MINRTIHIILLLLVTNAIRSQGVDYCLFRKYTQEDGLVGSNVKKIIRDRNGFIWIATQSGLSRFDGLSFTGYTPNSIARNMLSGSDVRELVEDTKNRLLWVIATEGGISAIDLETGKVIKTRPIPYRDPETFSLSMTFTASEKLWVGSFNGIKIYDIKADRFDPDPLLPSPYHKTPGYYEVSSIATDPYGNIWAFYCGYGVVIYDGQSKKILQKIPISRLGDHLKLQNIKCNSMIFVNQNELLLATSQGLRKISFSNSYEIHININPFITLPAINSEAIESLSKNKDGILIATKSGLYKVNESFKTYTILKEDGPSDDGIWFKSIHQILAEDKNIWLSCQQGFGYFSIEPNKFTKIYHDDESKQSLENVRSIFWRDSTHLLVGLSNGLATIDIPFRKIKITSKENAYHHIFKDPFGRINVSRQDDGMYIYEQNGLTPLNIIYPEFSAFHTYPTNSHIALGDSIIILGTENEKGILVWNYRRRTVIQIDRNNSAHLLNSNIVNNLFLDSGKKIWVLSDKDITILNEHFEQVKIISLVNRLSNQPIIFYFDMCENDSSYWITAYGTGLINLNRNYILESIKTKKDGLSDEGAYQVFPYKDSLLVTTNNGLSVFDIKAGKFKNYYQADGLHSNCFEEVSGFIKDQIIFAGGLRGLTEINPSVFGKNNSRPFLYINRISIQTANSKIDSSNNLFKKYYIPNNYTQASIFFSGINILNPEKITFLYRIIELHDDWLKVNDQNSISLIGLSHGTYHLQVQAFNEDSVPSEIKELTLIFLPKWYQTWWFKSLMALLAIAIIYAIYRIRINQLKKEENIRSRLASDLHDDLGSTLNSIKVYSNLALMDREKTEYIVKIKESTQEAVTGIRDIIWVLDDKKDTVEHLLTRLGQFADPLCEANNTRFVKNIENAAYQHKLENEEKRNLYMILKEAINNSIKYADCTVIELSITTEGKKLKITMRDNGKGFDTTGNSEGNGLKNMAKRSREIGYTFTISSTNEGTSVVLKRS